jgi:hypothetical protein
MVYKWFTTLNNWSIANLIGLPIYIVVGAIVIVFLIWLKSHLDKKKKEKELEKQKAEQKRDLRSQPQYSQEEKWPSHNGNRLDEYSHQDIHMTQSDKEFEALMMKGQHVGDRYKNELMARYGRIEEEMELLKQNVFKCQKAWKNFELEYQRLKKEKEDIEGQLNPKQKEVA